MITTAYSPSLFDRTVARRRPVWATALLVAAVYLPTLVAAASESVTSILTNPASRSVLTSPTAIAYTLIIAQIMSNMEPIVVRSLRPAILMEDQELAAIVRRASSISPLHEILSIVAGLLFAFAITGGLPKPGTSWQTWVGIVTGYVMCGLLSWLGFALISNTRVTSRLLRLPLRVDPLGLAPFEAIGRQSLAIALAFAGGITLGLLLGNYGSAALANIRFWLLFAPLFLLPVLLFFLNMIPTHRVLSRAKKRELETVRKELHLAFRQLLQSRQAGDTAGSLSSEVSALVAYEKQLDEASSWPYHPATLRTLIFGVLVPLVTVLARRVTEVVIQ